MVGSTLMILYFNHCLIDTCYHYLKAEFSNESWKLILKIWSVLSNQLFWWIYPLFLLSFAFCLVVSFCQFWPICLKEMDLNSWKKISIVLKAQFFCHNLPQGFKFLSNVKTLRKIAPNFCGLLKKTEQKRCLGSRPTWKPVWLIPPSLM